MTTETKTEVGTMRVDEAAKRLGIAKQTAYDLAARGELPGVLRLGRRILISRKQLEAFLEGKGK